MDASPRVITLAAAYEPAGSSVVDLALGVLFAALLAFCAVRCLLEPRQCAARPKAL